MHKYGKSAAITAVIIEAVLIFPIVQGIVQNTWKNLGLQMLAVVCVTFPFIFSYAANRKMLLLPNSFNLFFTLFIFASLYLGEINNFYIKYWWWDLPLHAAFGGYIVITFLHVIKGIIRREIEVSKNRYLLFTVIFAFSFAVSLGTLWEMFEFTCDFLFKTSMIKGGLEDTSADLNIKIAAAFLTSAYYYIKNRE